MSITFPPHGAANTQTSASRRSNAQASRVEMRPAKRRYVKKWPKKIQSPAKMFFKVDMILRLQQHLMKLFPLPPNSKAAKKPWPWQMCEFPWVYTSSGRLSARGPGCLFLLRVSVGQWAETQSSAPQHPQALSNSQWPKHPKKPSIKTMWNPLEFAMFLPTYLPTKIWNDPNNEKNELLFLRLIIYKIRSWMRWFRPCLIQGSGLWWPITRLRSSISACNARTCERSFKHWGQICPMCWSWKITTGKKTKGVFLGAYFQIQVNKTGCGSIWHCRTNETKTGWFIYNKSPSG